MIQIAICDDDNLITAQIERMIMNVCEKEHISADIDSFFSGEDLENEILGGARYDLLYLDIQMQCGDGMATARNVRKMDENVIFIFVSGYDKNVLELFQLNVFSFLKKPIQKKSFIETFLSANQKICKKQIYFTFRYRNEEYKVPCIDILYIESKARKIIVHLQNGETEVFNGKLKEVERRLSKGKVPFLRIHQSYLVNYHMIKSKTKTDVKMVNGQILPISEDRQREFGWEYERLLEEDYCL